MTLSVALTGNIASGKSTVAELFRRWGATIIAADELVREVQAPGSPVLAGIAAEFGSEFILPDGSLDRAGLRHRVMGDHAALARLNHIVHPAVQRRRSELLQQARARGDRIVVSDIPLLFETLDPSEFDAVILVDAPERVRRARLIAERHLSAEEADRMLASQGPSGPKRARSDFVIDNDGERGALEQATAQVWQALIARA